ncbi:MAG TPA: phosphoribosylglycinamide formyltransferase [Flavobacterium sp.]|uniref:phosphoribosylglycinamide formyltransferase n=1 Tax=unclassified Flavobacterium TaxID=196869 RepID=UPI000E82E606|nr:MULTISPECIES: phosphoribosylglycinamide formyltransferase [unclassified Flavobacterium]HBI00797.1 phosphoribosylglycinamide formyltransferase [Flavobacterium sp.]HRE76507.1 phosphoribosylglycinamide formyltransferase [Flavobacterium sp.]
MKNIVIFASGTGSNAENIIHYFKNNTSKSVVAVFSNNSNAKVVEKAKKLGVQTVTFNKDELYDDFVLSKLIELKPDLIVLAGFLLKFPEHIIKEFSNKIINIHPALLPKYGGKGMYGNYVHQAVLDNQETETGITIHFVNEHYDEGGIIFQKSISIVDCSTFEEVSQKVHQLEQEHFPTIIDQLLTRNP